MRTAFRGTQATLLGSGGEAGTRPSAVASAWTSSWSISGLRQRPSVTKWLSSALEMSASRRRRNGRNGATRSATRLSPGSALGCPGYFSTPVNLTHGPIDEESDREGLGLHHGRRRPRRGRNRRWTGTGAPFRYQADLAG